MQTISFNDPISIIDDGKWLITVTTCEANNTAFNKTDENYSFSITTPGYWSYRGAADTIKKLKQLLGLRSQMIFNNKLKN